jgi:hypothetical protein
MLSLRPFRNQADDFLDGQAKFLGLGRGAECFRRSGPSPGTRCAAIP